MPTNKAQDYSADTEFETRKIKLPSEIWKELDGICRDDEVEMERVLQEMLKKCISLHKRPNSHSIKGRP